MKITKVDIARFRGFQNVSFEMGEQLTAIAGQNGTQKSTLLGMLTQTFTISKGNPMMGEKPLCGGSYRSLFSEKFRLSPKFDSAGSHEWTLSFDNREDFVIESIKRDENSVRFWQKGKRSGGDGYIQYPTVFLSMKRLTPLAEEATIDTLEKLLTEEEENEFKKLHNKILIITDDVKIEGTIGLSSVNKQSLGINTNIYDWNQNSAGQDNLSKIILALFSFKRLKEKYPNEYEGGLLAIDELDATMYPASQRKLLEILRKYASNLDLQIVFTTHSLSILKEMDEMRAESTKDKATEKNIRTIFLKHIDNHVEISQDITFETIRLNLNVTVANKTTIQKIPVYTEDAETTAFAKSLLKRKANILDFIKVKLSCSSYIEMASRKIPAFTSPFSMIILDGDVRTDTKKMTRINNCDNILILPGDKSPERMIADFLHGLSDSSPLWAKLGDGYNKQFCFMEISYDEIMSNREKAKNWYNAQNNYWGRNATKVITPMMKTMEKDIQEFFDQFEKLKKKFIY